MQAVVYARLSKRPRKTKTKKGREIVIESKSIAQQVDLCKHYIAAREHELVAVFEEPEASGTDTEGRPELEKAILATIACKGILVCYRLDRLARKLLDFLTIAHRLKKKGATIALLDIGADTSTAAGRYCVNIMASGAQFEAERLSERMTAACEWKMANGFKTGSIRPFGWRDDPLDDDRMVKDEAEQAVITRIMEMRGQGMSYSAISRELADQAVMCRGVRWWPNSVMRIVLAQAANGQ